MRTLADRLAGVQQGWQNNEIAEKIKQQKEAELNMLQNRWKNGMPTLGGGQQVGLGSSRGGAPLLIDKKGEKSIYLRGMYC